MDRIKSITRGYGSMDYEHAGYQASDMVKLDMLVNGEPWTLFHALCIATKRRAGDVPSPPSSRRFIPRQQYVVAIQAAIGGKIVARETVGALRKDVTAKCYGGDITRKRKLLRTKGRQKNE